MDTSTKIRYFCNPFARAAEGEENIMRLGKHAQEERERERQRERERDRERVRETERE